MRPYAGLHDVNVSALAWDGETLWAGTFDAGLTRLRDGRWSQVAIDGPPRRRWINALCWDGEESPRRGASGTESPRRGASGTESPRRGASGTESPRRGASGILWVGSAAGLARWDAGSGSLEHLEIEGPVNSIRYQRDTLVVAGNDRVWIRRDEDWEIVELPGETLHAALLHDGTLWTGGMWGALERRASSPRRGAEKASWQRHSELNGRLPHSWVTALLPVGDAMWAGTYDAGLLVLAGDGPARVLRPDAWVNFNALARTRDGVAVGTMEDGLLLWNQTARSWRRLTAADGLPSDDVTAIVEVGDVLWVGTRGGVAAVRR